MPSKFKVWELPIDQRIESYKWICLKPGCERAYSTKFNRNKHMKKHKDFFPCTICDKGFKAQGVLNKHLRRMHPNA